MPIVVARHHTDKKGITRAGFTASSGAGQIYMTSLWRRYDFHTKSLLSSLWPGLRSSQHVSHVPLETEKLSENIIKSRIQWPSLLGMALLGLHLGTGDLKAQTTVSNLQTAVEDTQTPTAQDQKIQQLQDKLEEIQKELIELKRANSAQPETHHVTTAKASAPPPAISEEESVITDPSNPKSEPFAFADFTWLTGNPRTKDTPYATKFFSPEIRSDVNYTYDFRHPQDDAISGTKFLCSTRVPTNSREILSLKLKSPVRSVGHCPINPLLLGHNRFDCGTHEELSDLSYVTFA
jgi:hypothetical protein